MFLVLAGCSFHVVSHFGGNLSSLSGPSGWPSVGFSGWLSLSIWRFTSSFLQIQALVLQEAGGLQAVLSPPCEACSVFLLFSHHTMLSVPFSLFEFSCSTCVFGPCWLFRLGSVFLPCRFSHFGGDPSSWSGSSGWAYVGLPFSSWGFTSFFFQIDPVLASFGWALPF